MLVVGGFACAGERASNTHGEKGRAGQVAAGSETAARAPSGHTAPGQATGGARRYRLNCRMQTYVIKEDLSKAEVRDFTARITYRVVANLDGSGNKDLGEILDDMGIPPYEDLCG
jgi:hypothetical protein